MNPDIYTKRMTLVLGAMLVALAVMTLTNLLPDKGVQQEAAVLRAYGN